MAVIRFDSVSYKHYFCEVYKAYLNHIVFKTISEVIAQTGQQAFVIGGFVRDIILNRPSQDIDIVTLGSGLALADKVAHKLGVKKVTVFKNFGTAMFYYQGLEIEFVGARKESYERHSRKPIVENGSLEDDQNRRDFTINALALDLSPERFGQLVDPFGGLDDIENLRIVTPLDPVITFSDDPLRMMRAIRFSTQLGFFIDDKTIEAIENQASRIEIVSKERITDELNKMIMSPRPSEGFKLLFSTGLLNFIFPEMVKLHGVQTIGKWAHKDNFFHTLEVLDNISAHTKNLWLRWAAILHDIGKPSTQRFVEGQGWTFHAHEVVGSKMTNSIFFNLKLPMNEKMKYVQKLVFLHLRPIVLASEHISDSAVRRMLFEAGDDIEDLMLLAEADVTSKNEAKVHKYLKNFKIVRQKLIEIEEKDRVRNWQAPIDGEEIMRIFALQPSKQVGILKEQIKEAVLDGLIPNEREAVYQFLVNQAQKIGLEVIAPIEKLKNGLRATFK